MELDYLVSVFMISYNQQDYIIEGSRECFKSENNF